MGRSVHDPRGLGTGIGRCVGVGSQVDPGSWGYINGNVCGDSGTPAFETQNAIDGLRRSDRPAQTFAGIAGEKRHGTAARTRTQNHVVHLQNPCRRRAGGHGRHQDLIRRKRRDPILIRSRRPGMIDPPAHPGGTQIVGLSPIDRGKIGHGKVRCGGQERERRGQQQGQSDRAT